LGSHIFAFSSGDMVVLSEPGGDGDVDDGGGAGEANNTYARCDISSGYLGIFLYSHSRATTRINIVTIDKSRINRMTLSIFCLNM
jgi:hypothetical protein